MTIDIIDHHFQSVPQAIATYVLHSADGPILIETGPSTTLDNVIVGLARLGWAPGDVRHVLVTHIHFDHAGAAGWWAAQGAHIYVHHIGAPHLHDPSRLVRSATRIYGDAMDRLWGAIDPVPRERLTALYDGDELNLGGVRVAVWETPGHASHHHTFVVDGTAFTGDAAAVRLAGTPMVSLPAPPPEFDPALWHQSLDRLAAARFDRIYPTHFGPVDDVADHIATVRGLIDDSAEFVRRAMQAGDERDAIVAAYEAWNAERARAAGLTDAQIRRYEVANPLYMSVDGIMRYWHKRS